MQANDATRVQLGANPTAATEQVARHLASGSDRNAVAQAFRHLAGRRV